MFAQNKPSLTQQEVSKQTLLLKQDFLQKNQAEFNKVWQEKKVVLGDKVMPFLVKTFGQPTKNGYPLYISMHGGGGAPKRVNDGQWQNQIKLYKPKNGIYVAPRAPTDTWNLWHQSHIDPMFKTLINSAIYTQNVDPNRIYVMGYSAGGDGTFQLAPRLADWWAGAAMMAGHPGDAAIMNLRNLYFSVYMGGKDAAYKRNEWAKIWGEKLDYWQTKEQAFKHDVEIYPECGHWMKLKDAVAIERLAKQVRNPYPKKVMWQQDNVMRDRFYWLKLDDDQLVKGSKVIAEIIGQEIKLLHVSKLNFLTIRLNDQLVDLDKEVTVTYQGIILFSGKLSRSLEILKKSFNELSDATNVYYSEIKVPIFDFGMPEPNRSRDAKFGVKTADKVTEIWEKIPEPQPKVAFKPKFYTFLPKLKTSDAAVIICPGGGYVNCATTHEGATVAQWFNSIGMTAFVVDYRRGGKMKCGFPAPLDDVRQVQKLISENAGQYDINPNKIGIMGFSAGGHLAALTSTYKTDSLATKYRRPAFTILGYPVITLLEKYMHYGSRRNLFGNSKMVAVLQKALSPELLVDEKSPITFAFHSLNDKGVSYKNSQAYVDALRKNGVEATLKLYDTGHHGYGFGPKGEAHGQWYSELYKFLVENGIL